ncbi:MAG TPA: hypothetical protein VK206_24205, partial [Anaerolineales bacterium]|nr:hypothetical protein [Anaerolineales bacterium]
MKRILIFALVICLTSGCATQSTHAQTLPSPATNFQLLIPTASPPAATASQKPKKFSPITPVATSTIASTLVPRTPNPARDPTTWKEWPVIPENIDPTLQKIYERGLVLGNDPHAFSIFGDCQERPKDFFGVFETDTELVASLSPELQEAVNNFQGSFNRESPTAQDGTTPGALLWNQWHRGEYGCTFAETPVECELRIHRPSFVIIQIGTHFESRNTEYLRKVILQLLDAGVVPILATKADNREKDERINRDMAMLASEYDLPLWNFWAALSDLPDRGLYIMKGRELQGPVYLNEEAT